MDQAVGEPVVHPGDLLLACARFTRSASRLDHNADPSAVWRAMATLEEAGPLRVSEFAELDHCSQPTATTMLNRLERDGFATRIDDPDDGRARLVSITDRGRARLAELRLRTARLIREQLGDQIPVSAEEVAAAVDVINRLTGGLVASRTPARTETDVNQPVKGRP